MLRGSQPLPIRFRVSYTFMGFFFWAAELISEVIFTLSPTQKVPQGAITSKL